MENETTENETPNNEETVTPEVTTETPETPTLSEAEIAELKKKAEIADNYRIRAEKAEGKLKAIPPKEKKDDDKNLSTKDTIALIEAKVSSEDFDEVVNWATYRKIPVTEALKDKTLKVILKEKEEERQTAAATVVKTGNRGSQSNTGADLIKRARKGDLPQTESEIDDLVEAEWAERMKNVK